MDKTEYIDAFIAERFDCDNRELRKKIKPLLREVLRAAWDDVKDRLHELYVDVVTTSCHLVRAKGYSILLHEGQMYNYSEYGIRYVIAHEIGHFAQRGGSEKGADDMVRKWGFGEDMRIYRSSLVHSS